MARSFERFNEIVAPGEPEKRIADCDHPFRVTGDMCLNCGEWDTDVVAMRGRLRELEAQSERRRKLLEISDARVSRLSERLEEAEAQLAEAKESK